MKRTNCLQGMVGILVGLLVAIPAGCGGNKTGSSKGTGGDSQGVGGVTGIGGGAGQGTGGATTGGGGLSGTGGNGAGGLLVGGASGSAAGGNKGTGGVGSGGNPPGTGGRATGGAGGASGGSIDGGTGGRATGGAGGAGGGGIDGGTGGRAAGGAGGAGGGGVDRGTGGTGAGGFGTGGTKPGSGGIVGTGGATTGGTQGSGGSTAQVCPGSTSYVGDRAWPDKLVVTSGAKYCGHFKEMRNLEQEYAAKARLTIAPGTYPLPSSAGTYNFALPICFERRPGEPVPTFAGAGQVKATSYKSTVDSFVSNSLDATQPIRLEGSPAWIFSMRLGYFGYTGTPQPPVLDGSYLCHLSTGQVGDTRPGYQTYLELCQGTACDDLWQDVRFEACVPDYPLQRHTVTFAGGQIVLDVPITGAVGVTVMLAAFTSASGTLDGKAFTQTDYWKLVYSADHHHFLRNFAVLFDTPIGDACGLKILKFYGTQDALLPLPEVDTIRCDLTTIAPLAVSSATVEHL
jgi:hypothetical protein